MSIMRSMPKSNEQFVNFVAFFLANRYFIGV